MFCNGASEQPFNSDDDMHDEIPHGPPVVTAERMRALDRHAVEQLGIPSLVLMENAARGALESMGRLLGSLDRRSIVILCGKGNNGGDGLAIARLALVAGARVRAILACEPARLSVDAAAQLRMLEKLPEVSICRWESFCDSPSIEIDLIVDALLGTGSNGAPTAPYDAMIVWANAQPALRFAVDIPSGLDSDSGIAGAPTFRADATATMAALKPGLLLADGPSMRGVLDLVHIGLPLSCYSGYGLELLDRSLCRALLPRVEQARHKYDRGKILVVGGSRGMMGAPIMSAEAALSAGAGLVVLTIPEGSQRSPHPVGPEVMTRYLPSGEQGSLTEHSLAGLRDELPGFAAMVVGPGLSRTEGAANLVRSLAGQTDRPLVIDADGIGAFAGQMHLFTESRSPIVITPHHGELARLLGLPREEITRNPLDIARRVASDSNIHVVLKGAPTIVAFPDGRAWINGAGNPGMATAGSGDLLAGIIASLVAQSGSVARGTLAAVYLHSLAGDIACAQSSVRSLRATEILAAIPSAYRLLEETR